MADFKKLFEKIRQDENLKNEFAKAVKQKKTSDFFQSIGENVTEEEINSFLKNKKAELNEKELEKVTGAGCGMSSVMLSIGTFGLGCLGSSIDEGFDSSCVTASVD